MSKSKDGMDYSFHWVTKISKTANDIIELENNNIIDVGDINKLEVPGEEKYKETRKLEDMKLIEALEKDKKYKLVCRRFKISHIADKIPSQKKSVTCCMYSHKIPANIESRDIDNIAKLLGKEIHGLEIVYYPFYLIIIKMRDNNIIVEVRDGLTGKKQPCLNSVMVEWVQSHSDLFGDGCESGEEMLASWRRECCLAVSGNSLQ